MKKRSGTLSVTSRPASIGFGIGCRHSLWQHYPLTRLHVHYGLYELPTTAQYWVTGSRVDLPEIISRLEPCAESSVKLKKPNTQDEKFEDFVKSAQQVAVLVMVYCNAPLG